MNSRSSRRPRATSRRRPPGTRSCSAGVQPRLLPGGCTNGNIAIARGIPAVTLSRGGEEFGTHTLAEWFDPRGVWVCEQRSLLLLLALAGVEGEFAPLDLRV